MNDFRGLTALIVEPQAGMRGSLHNMLNQCGLTKIEHAVSSGTAIRHLQTRSYDLILCEYDLGEGQDGQQLLEDLRHNKIIPAATVFFMVTAERAYQKVMGAAEFAPNDYILKPFTADTLLDRIRRAVEKRTSFAPVYQLMARGEYDQAIDACVKQEVASRYGGDFKRLRAEMLLSRGEPKQAELVYGELFESRKAPWAKLGVAKALLLQDKPAEAEQVLTVLVAEHASFMDAYDWLAKAHEANGRLAEAQAVLANAVGISPHAVRRLRKLGEVAFQTGDVNAAEKVFQQVVSKSRYSEFRDPEDHVRLVKTLVQKGDATQAATVIRDLEKSLSGQPNTKACHAISSALLFQQTGDAVRAAEQLTKAVEACRDSVGLSAEMKMSLAKQCLEQNFDEGAAEVMLEVMNNAPNSTAMAQAMQLFEQAGRPELAEATARESRRVVVALVTAGADKARQGDFHGAVELMMEAVKKLPENPQVVFNAAVAVLKHLENLGWDARLGEQARALIDSARRLDAGNPRLASLTALYTAIQKKSSAAGVAVVPTVLISRT